jgi:F-type H+-transporting ATPase subunit a
MLPLADHWIPEHLLKIHPLFHGSGGVLELLGSILWVFGISKHVLSLFIAFGLMWFIFPTIAKDDSIVPKGMRNFFEVIMLFIRDEVAKPFLGPNTDKFLPVLWTFFFFILFNNLIGLVPGMTTATGSYLVTGTLALTAMFWYHACGIAEQGAVAYIKNIVPPGLPLWLLLIMIPVELVGIIAKPFALTVRLFANMTGGHAVLYAFVGLVLIFQSWALGPVSVLAAIPIYMLELFVAFIQAYVFTFLVTVFLGAAVHPEH